MRINSIRKVKNLSGRRVLLRVDFNVPIEKGEVKDEYKIVQTLPTIRFLLRQGCKIIIITHLGQPGGKIDPELTVLPVAKRLSEILAQKVKFVDQDTDFRTGTAASNMKNRDIVMFENLRFNAGEEKNDRKFAQNLAKCADLYVNDAFGVSHRAHASVDSIKNYLPSYAGLLLEKEIINLEKAKNPVQPLILILGGAKINTKIQLIEKFKNRAYRILIGGALANNFFKALGLEVGKSLIDKDSLEFARNRKIKNIVLPLDVITDNGQSGPKIKSIYDVADNDAILDIGPKTIRFYAGFISKAATIIWNGPMGMFENPRYKHGTLAIALLVAARSTGRAFGVVGGGETVEALKMTKMADHVDWVSTGGGATLAYLGGEKMPGLKDIVF